MLETAQYTAYRTAYGTGGYAPDSTVLARTGVGTAPPTAGGLALVARQG